MDWQNRCSSIIILLLAFSGTSYAMNADELFDFLDQTKIISNVSEIDYNEKEWTPNIVWQTAGYTNAWIDIVGYNYSVKKDTQFYTNYSQEDAARVMYGLSHNVDMWNWGVSSLSGELIDRTYDGSCVTVTLETTLVYYESRLVCTDTWLGRVCHVVKTYYTEVQTFQDTDCNPPDIYPDINLSQNVSVFVYNNTIAPKCVVSFPDIDYIMGYRISYLNESVEYFTNVMIVEKLDTGFPYGNITPTESQTIFDESDMFSRIGSSIIINSSTMNESLSIEILTPYKSGYINYSIINQSELVKMNKPAVKNAFKIIVLIAFCIFLIKYIRR